MPLSPPPRSPARRPPASQNASAAKPPSNPSLSLPSPHARDDASAIARPTLRTRHPQDSRRAQDSLSPTSMSVRSAAATHAASSPSSTSKSTAHTPSTTPTSSTPPATSTSTSRTRTTSTISASSSSRSTTAAATAGVKRKPVPPLQPPQPSQSSRPASNSPHSISTPSTSKPQINFPSASVFITPSPRTSSLRGSFSSLTSMTSTSSSSRTSTRSRVDSAAASSRKTSSTSTSTSGPTAAASHPNPNPKGPGLSPPPERKRLPSTGTFGVGVSGVGGGGAGARSPTARSPRTSMAATASSSATTASSTGMGAGMGTRPTGIAKRMSFGGPSTSTSTIPSKATSSSGDRTVYGASASTPTPSKPSTSSSRAPSSSNPPSTATSNSTSISTPSKSPSTPSASGPPTVRRKASAPAIVGGGAGGVGGRESAGAAGSGGSGGGRDAAVGGGRDAAVGGGTFGVSSSSRLAFPSTSSTSSPKPRSSASGANAPTSTPSTRRPSSASVPASKPPSTSTSNTTQRPSTAVAALAPPPAKPAKRSPASPPLVGETSGIPRRQSQSPETLRSTSTAASAQPAKAATRPLAKPPTVASAPTVVGAGLAAASRGRGDGAGEGAPAQPAPSFTTTPPSDVVSRSLSLPTAVPSSSRPPAPSIPHSNHSAHAAQANAPSDLRPRPSLTTLSRKPSTSFPPLHPSHASPSHASPLHPSPASASPHSYSPTPSPQSRIGHGLDFARPITTSTGSGQSSTNENAHLRHTADMKRLLSKPASITSGYASASDSEGYRSAYGGIVISASGGGRNAGGQSPSATSPASRVGGGGGGVASGMVRGRLRVESSDDDTHGGGGYRSAPSGLGGGGSSAARERERVMERARDVEREKIRAGVFEKQRERSGSTRSRDSHSQGHTHREGSPKGRPRDGQGGVWEETVDYSFLELASPMSLGLHSPHITRTRSSDRESGSTGHGKEKEKEKKPRNVLKRRPSAKSQIPSSSSTSPPSVSHKSSALALQALQQQQTLRPPSRAPSQPTSAQSSRSPSRSPAGSPAPGARHGSSAAWSDGSRTGGALTPAGEVVMAYKQQLQRRSYFEDAEKAGSEKHSRERTDEDSPSLRGRHSNAPTRTPGNGGQAHSSSRPPHQPRSPTTTSGKHQITQMKDSPPSTPYYTVFGSTSGRVVAVGGPEDSWSGVSSRSGNHSGSTPPGMVHGRSWETSTSITAGKKHSEGLGRTLSRKVSSRWKRSGVASDSGHDDVGESLGQVVARGRPSLQERRVSRKATTKGDDGLTLSFDKFSRAPLDGGPKSAVGLTTPRTLTGIKSVPPTLTVDTGHSIQHDVGADKAADSLPQPRSRKSEPPGGSKLWNLMKRISSGALRDKYNGDSSSSSSPMTPPPPVPALPKDYVLQNGPQSTDGHTMDQTGVYSRFMQSRTSMSATRPTTSPSHSSPSFRIPTRPPIPTPASAPLPSSSGQRPSTTTRSSSPVSSDVASSKFFVRTQSQRSSTSSLGEIPPMPNKFVGRHIVPPSELYKLDLNFSADSQDKPDMNATKPSRPSTASSQPSSTPSLNRQPFNSEDWMIVQTPAEERPSLSLPISRPRRQPAQTPTGSPPSPIIPEFSTTSAINTFASRRPSAGAGDGSGRPKMTPPVTSSLPTKVNLPTFPLGSPPPPRPSRSVQRPSTSGGSSRVTSPASSTRRPTTSKNDSSSSRESTSTHSVASTARPRTRSTSFTTPATPHTAQSTMTFRELSEQKHNRTEREKADMWDDLLERSERAGGTLHLKGAPETLASDELRFSQVSSDLT